MVFVTTSLITWLSTYFQVERGLAQDKAGHPGKCCNGARIVGAPLGGYLTDRWRKTQSRARLLFPTISTVMTAILLFAALNFFNGIIQLSPYC